MVVFSENYTEELKVVKASFDIQYVKALLIHLLIYLKNIHFQKCHRACFVTPTVCNVQLTLDLIHSSPL